MTSWFLSPSVRGGKTNEGRPTMIHGWFDLNGATDPDTFSPLITSVRRLENAGALPFFRVKLDGPEPLGEGGAITLGVRPSADNLPAIAQDLSGVAVAAPADVRSSSEIDIGLYPLGGVVPVDTAGNRVYFTLSWYQ